MCRYSGEAGLQTVASCASGAHVLEYAPLRFSEPTWFGRFAPVFDSDSA